MPLILISCLYWFRGTSFSSLAKGNKVQILSISLLLFLVIGNIWTSSFLVYAASQDSIIVEQEMIDLQKINSMTNVTSINIVDQRNWNQMWAYYFLFVNKTIYLKYRTYYLSSPQSGEWTLQNTYPDNVLNFTNSNDIIEINHVYYLMKNDSKLYQAKSEVIFNN